jgi:SusD family.
MKRIIFNILIVAAMLPGFTSCSNDLLDTAPYDKLASANMWKTESLCEGGVAGIYAALRGWGPGIANAGGAGNFLFDCFGMIGQVNYDNNGGFFREGVTAGSGILSDEWVRMYRGVYRANDAIENISNAPIDEKVKGRLVAEAKVLRALFYQQLNTLYGGNGLGVPYYDVNLAAKEYTKGQTPEMEVWDKIIQDLTDAINEPNLPNNYVDKKDGKVSKGAAYALRGKVYLYRAQSKGHQNQDGKSDYTAAAADFAKVGEMGYGLYAPTGTPEDFYKLFKESAENSNEMILSVQYIEEPTKAFGINRKFQNMFQMGGGDNAASWTDVQISPLVVDLYEVKVSNTQSKPFNWDEFIPGYNALDLAAREVYFLRDTKDKGNEIHEKITEVIGKKLESSALSSVANQYLPEGNEDRIRAAYANRDPRLHYSIICPYDTILGCNANPPTAADYYVMRWPWAAVGNKTKGFTNGTNKEGAWSNVVPGMLSDLVANSEQLFYGYRKFAPDGMEFAYRQSTPIDEPLIRYADVLLMWAEALVEINDLDGAKNKVEQVRNRVGMPTMASDFANATSARNYVRDERRREFVNEGINFFDEMRWRTLKAVKYDKIQNAGLKAWGAAANTNKISWPGDFYYVWAVPKAEVDKNANLTKTPGWIY